MNIEAALKEAMAIDGAVGVCLVDWDSGMSLGSLGGGKYLDLGQSPPGNARIPARNRGISPETAYPVRRGIGRYSPVPCGRQRHTYAATAATPPHNSTYTGTTAAVDLPARPVHRMPRPARGYREVSDEQLPPVSRPAWLNAIAGTGSARRSPVEILANAASYLGPHPGREASGLRYGWFGGGPRRWPRYAGDCTTSQPLATAHNDRVPPTAAGRSVVLVDRPRTASRPHPGRGYVGQVLTELRLRLGQPWRVLNLSTWGALIRDVLGHPAGPAARHARLGDLRIAPTTSTTPPRPGCSATCARWSPRCPTTGHPRPAAARRCGASSAGFCVPYVRPDQPAHPRQAGDARCRSPRYPRTSSRRGGASSPRPVSTRPGRLIPGLQPGPAGRAGPSHQLTPPPRPDRPQPTPRRSGRRR